MALKIAGYRPSCSPAQPIGAPDRTLSSAIGARHSSRGYTGRVVGVGISTATTGRRRGRAADLVVRASLEAVAGDELVGTVTEVCKDTFWPIVNGAGEKTVVLDMYTQWYLISSGLLRVSLELGIPSATTSMSLETDVWCGPCKVIAPKYKDLAEKYTDCIFLKLDCNQDNKPLAKELGIRVVPTFKILKDNKVVKEVTGAKFDDLVAAIETVRSS